MIERTFINESIKKIRIRNYLAKELDKAGFTGMEINKTPMVTRIILNVTRPGLAIGKGGKNIKMLTNEIEKKFNIDNPQIEINEIKNPELDAKATVSKMTALIERGFSWKSVSFRTVDDIIGAGAQGVELLLKGKLAGKGGRKMKQRIAKGYMKRAGSLTELVDYAQADVYPKAGAIGIKLRIIRPGIVFPDKVNVSEFLEKEKAEEKEEKTGKEEAVEKEGKGEKKEETEEKAKESAEMEGKKTRKKVGKKEEGKEKKEKTGKKGKKK